MEKQDAIQIWNEICFLLSDSIENNISEKDYESQIVRALEALGWKEFSGEIKRQPELKIGRSNKLRPDIVVYDKNDNPIIAIEVKKPSEKLSRNEPADQLTSYMLQLKAEYGLLIGNRIRFYYDGRENQRRDSLLLQRIDFNRGCEEGMNFVKIFNRSDFLDKSHKVIVKSLINDFLAERNINKLRNILKEKETLIKIVDSLKEEYSDFGTDVVEAALNGIRIDVSFESEVVFKNDIPGVESDGLFATVFDTIERNEDGISRKELINITGFSDKQISNAIYNLKKKNSIENVRIGVYRAIKNKLIIDDVNEKPVEKFKPSSIKNKLPELKQGTLTFNVYELIRNRQKGISVEEIKTLLGHFDRKIDNVLYKLKKREYIHAIERGFYMAL